MSSNNQQAGSVSPELDAMACDMMGAFLDSLADGDDPGVVACAEDESGARCAVAFSDDGDEACLEAADDFIRSVAKDGSAEDDMAAACRYVIIYLGCVQNEYGAYVDAMITTFGERGSESAYSAFTLIKGIGQGESFMWSDPEPAGEEPLLF